MTKHLLRRIAVASVALLILTGCSGSGTPQAGTAAEPPTARRAGSQNLVSAEAVVVPYREAALSFRNGGRVTEVLVQEGDAVKAGQELVHTDQRDLEQGVLQAEAALKSAEAALAKARAGVRPEEITAAEASLAAAQADVRAAEHEVEVAESNREVANAKVATAESGLAVTQGNLAGAQARIIEAQAQLNKLMAGPTADDISIAEKEVERARNELYAIQKQHEIGAVSAEQVKAAESMVKIAQLQLDRLKAGNRAEDINVARSEVTQAKADVQVAQGQMRQAASAVDQAKSLVTIADGQVSAAHAQAETARATARQAEARLARLRAGSRSEDVTAAEADVARGQAVLAEAQSNLSDATLKAPFDSIVGTVLINEGELALPQRPIITVGDLSRWRVQTEDLSEADVSRVQVGQDAVVTVDALEGKKLQGRVAEISPIASDSRGDKVYTVKVDLEPVADSGLRWGMSAFMESTVR
jgi:HlyD family secretion protein